MKFQTSLALFQYLLELDENNMESNLPEVINEDHAFYSEVLALIRAHQENQKQTVFNALIGKQAEALVEDHVIHDLVDKQIGVYKLVKKLGQGGMGVVYLGLRNDGKFEQKVAIKFVYPSIELLIGEKSWLKEAQHLANLGHVNITKIITVGKTDNKLSYTVMEYVDGVSFDVYCQSHNLNLVSRLKLFQKVCNAVHFAHSNMVVHADIKPSNILIDKLSEPKLMDFGIAQNIDLALDGKSSHSQSSPQSVKALSSAYASPEQLKGEKLTLASDIFSLGKLLKQILLNFDSKDTSLVVDKCLSEKKEERYSSALDLSRDISNFIESRPISLRKREKTHICYLFLKRNIALSIFAFTLMTVVIGSSIALSFKNKQLTEEVYKSKQLTEFLTTLISSGDPVVTQGKELKVKDLILKGVDKIRTDPNTLNEEKYELLNIMSKSLYNLGHYGESISVLSSLPTNDIQLSKLSLAKTRFNQAKSYKAISEFDKAIENYTQTLELLGGIASEESELLKLRSYQNIAEVYVKQDKIAIAKKNISTALEKIENAHFDSIITTEINITASKIHLRLGEFDDSRFYIEKAIKNSAEIKSARADLEIEVWTTFGNILAEQSNWNEAKEKYLISHELAKTLYGNNHPISAKAQRNIGFMDEMLGDFDEAILSYKSALNIVTEHHGSNSVEAAELYNDLAIASQTKGDYDFALMNFKLAKNAYIISLGENNSEVATVLSNIATIYADMGLYEREIELYEESIKITENVFGRNHPKIAIRLAHAGQSYIDQRLYLQAEPLINEAVAISLQVFGEKHKVTADNFLIKGNLLLSLGKLSEANVFLMKAASLYEDIQGTENHIDIASVYNSLGINAKRGNDLDKALVYHEKSVELATKSVGELHKRTQGFRVNLADLYIHRREIDKAKSMLEQLLDYYNKNPHLNEHPDEVKTKSLLSCINNGLDTKLCSTI